MPEVRFVPDGKTAVVRPGTTLLEAGRKARVQIRTRCSGGLSCLMCKVQVSGEADALTPPSAQERAKLGELEQQGYRYACQTKVMKPVTVALPEDPLKAAVRAQLKRQQEQEELW